MHECPIENGPRRRGVLATVLMIGGLIAGYGTGLWNFLQYLVPLRRQPRTDLFVGTLAELPVGSSRTVVDPQGQKIAVTRTAGVAGDPTSGFKALSSICPHLGCNVHWDGGRSQFICPCHNGVFDANGTAIAGPPAAEGKNLKEFPVKVDARNGWVFVEVSVRGRYGV